MVTHLLRGSLLRQASSLSSRHFSVHSTFKRSAWRNTSKGFRWSLASGAVLATSAVFLQSAIHADALDPPKNDDHKKPTPLSSLIRSYIVYTACCIPGLVDWSPAILSTLMSVPLLKQITEAIVRVTFFNQVSNALSDKIHELILLLVRRRRHCSWNCSGSREFAGTE